MGIRSRLVAAAAGTALAAVLASVAAPAGAATGAGATPPRHGPAPQEPVVSAPATVLDGEQGTASVTFDLPPNAQQGPDEWYVFRLRTRLVWAGDGDGAAGLTADVNGRVVSQVELQAGPSGRRLFYNGVVTGPKQRTADREAASLVEYDNYLQLESVRGGRNTLTLRYEDYTGHVLDRAEVLGGSTLFRTSAHPYPLEVGVPTETVVITAGTPSIIPYELRHSGAEPPPVTVSVDSSMPDLRILSPARQRIDDLGSHHRSEVRVDADEPGSYELRIAAIDGATDPAAVVSILVEPSPLQPWRLAALAVLLLFGVLSLVSLGRRLSLRRRQPSPSTGAAQ